MKKKGKQKKKKKKKREPIISFGIGFGVKK